MSKWVLILFGFFKEFLHLGTFAEASREWVRLPEWILFLSKHWWKDELRINVVQGVQNFKYNEFLALGFMVVYWIWFENIGCFFWVLLLLELDGIIPNLISSIGYWWWKNLPGVSIWMFNSGFLKSRILDSSYLN